MPKTQNHEKCVEVVRIPDERRGVLIGSGAATKKKIEELTKTKIVISDVVTVEGDAIETMVAKNIITAIGRGFSPERAMKLAEDDCLLEVINFSGEVGEGRAKTLKARLIGAGGKTRKIIEELSGAYISIYGKTVGIIGGWQQVRTAKNAVEQILEGKPHAVVYKYLEHAQKENL